MDIAYIIWCCVEYYHKLNFELHIDLKIKWGKMKKITFLILVFCFALSVKAQNTKQYAIISSNLGSSGSSKIITSSKGNYAVSQSVGQSSVIGTYSNKGYSLRQGYQQPLNKIKIVKEVFKNNDLTATVFPNPFEQSVFVSFDEDIEKEILVSVFDVAGKQIYHREFKPLQRIELNLNNLQVGTYILKVLSNSKLFNSKLVKK